MIARFAVRPELLHRRHHQWEKRRQQVLQQVADEEVLLPRLADHGRWKDCVASVKEPVDVKDWEVVRERVVAVVVAERAFRPAFAGPHLADQGELGLGDQRVRPRPLSEAQALDHVFAYACFNDATFRDYQRKTTQWTVGKNFDATGGFGPWLVTADELPPGCKGLHIESRLNGQVMQSASTTDMVFHVAPTIAMMSACMTLEPGDVIVMGTPAGV